MAKRPIPNVLTADERTRLLAVMPSGTLLQRRNLAMVRLMLNLGLRSHEVCDLRVLDIHWPSGKVLVRGKGGRQRILWIKDDDLELLVRHYQEAAPLGLLFQTGTRNKIDTSFLRVLVENYRVRAGLEKNVHPHLLRHTFATDLLRETKNLPLVMKSLGHSDIGTTSIYLHIVDDELESALKNFRR